MILPEKVPGDWDDIPKPGINYKTSVNMKMDIAKQKKAVAGYYAAVTFLDAQVTVAQARGKGHVHLDEVLERTDLFENEALVFTHFSLRHTREEIARHWLTVHPAK